LAPSIVRAMTPCDRLLCLIQDTPDIERCLRSFGFDIQRKRYGDGLRLASGAPLEAIAGESAGGAYFLCPEKNGRRPVVFASSEGQGGLFADDLASALEIIIGLAWQDCLGFSGGGDVQVMQVSRDMPSGTWPRRSPTSPRTAPRLPRHCRCASFPCPTSSSGCTTPRPGPCPAMWW
jgi:hypothetical protein